MSHARIRKQFVTQLALACNARAHYGLQSTLYALVYTVVPIFILLAALTLPTHQFPASLILTLFMWYALLKLASLLVLTIWNVIYMTFALQDAYQSVSGASYSLRATRALQWADVDQRDDWRYRDASIRMVHA